MGDDKKLSNVIMVGLGLTLIGGVGAGFMFLGSIAFGLGAYIVAGFFGLMFMVGLGMLVWGISSGLNTTKKLGSATVVEELQGVKVVARFAVNEIGETVFSDFIPEESRLYVRLNLPTGRSVELKTSMNVWEAAGEGLEGTAWIQGDWLGRFERNPIPKPVQ
ncbi:MAG TPA: hypothetical protein PKA27_03020 [Fimbriimonadaceae bacterium]|nr:hypothetical protein [Fimbriimonadaceae bacterium]